MFVQVHEISAHELPQFYTTQLKTSLELMTSRIISYSNSPSNDPNDRFLLIFEQDANYSHHPLNEEATKLLATALTPTCINLPFQGWTFDRRSITVQENFVDRVCGKAIIAREKKIDGRWQLVSM